MSPSNPLSHPQYHTHSLTHTHTHTHTGSKDDIPIDFGSLQLPRSPDSGDSMFSLSSRFGDADSLSVSVSMEPWEMIGGNNISYLQMKSLIEHVVAERGYYDVGSRPGTALH